MSDIWIEYCPECKRKTNHRYLDCEEHGEECDLIICCECGSDHQETEEPEEWNIS